MDQLLEYLDKNGFSPHLCSSTKDARQKIIDLIPAGALIGIGGSQTIRQLGMVEILLKQGHKVYDNWDNSLNPTELREVMFHHLSCDVFLTSTNALTRDGKLINTDNTGNRVAAMIYGPRHVILVAGVNKIVDSIEDGFLRIKQIVAPHNSKRRQGQTPCAIDGMCTDCNSPDRICRVNMILDKKTQGVDTFSIILVNEDLGC